MRNSDLKMQKLASLKHTFKHKVTNIKFMENVLCTHDSIK